MLKGKSVLIVEDEFLIAELLEDMVRQLGCGGARVAATLPKASDDF